MGNRVISVLLAIFVLFTFSSFSLSQDMPATGEKKEAVDPNKVPDEAKEDKAAEDVKAMDKDEATDKGDTTDKSTTMKDTEVKSPAENAKTYFDGYITFVNALVLFKLTSTDNILEDKIFYKVDTGEFSLYDKPFAVKQEGTHSVTYYSIDKMGNKENIHKVLNFITDNTAPSVVVTTNMPVIKDKIYASENLKFSVSAKDDLSGVGAVEYSTDGKIFSTYDKPFYVITDNPVELIIKVRDNVDNASGKFLFKAVDEMGKPQESAVSSLKIHVDKVAPVVTIQSDKDLVEKDGRKVASIHYKYKINATDAGSGIAEVLVRVDGKGDFRPYKKEIEFTENGDHQIEAMAKDKVGNLSNTVILSVYVDYTPPVSGIEFMTEK